MDKTFSKPYLPSSEGTLPSLIHTVDALNEGPRLGTPIHPRNDYRSFRELILQANLRQVRIHDLRHTAASVLLAQGVPARVVMEILGHSQISVTLNTYAHVAPEVSREAAERVNDALWGDG
jgi:integrase